MKYDIQAKPTKYNGVNFRSKLEAQWAAFFDLCEINYEYEPERFETWEPDFLIHGKRPVYIEVKPFINEQIIYDYISKCSSVIKCGTISNVTTYFLDKYIENTFLNPEYSVVIISSPIGHHKNTLSEGFEEVPIGVHLQFNPNGFDFSSLYWKDNFDFSSKMYEWDGLLGRSENAKFFLPKNKMRLISSIWNAAKNKIQTKIS